MESVKNFIRTSFTSGNYLKTAGMLALVSVGVWEVAGRYYRSNITPSNILSEAIPDPIKDTFSSKGNKYKK